TRRRRKNDAGEIQRPTRHTAMQTLLSTEFWSTQIAAAFQAWAIWIPLILAFVVASGIKKAITAKKLRELLAYTDAAESRLQSARDLNAREANTLARLRAEIVSLRRLIEAQPKSTVVETALEVVDISAARLAMANSTTDHVLTAGNLAIGNLEKEQNLR